MLEQERMYKALAAVQKATQPKRANWVIGGSVSLMLRGLPLLSEPSDLDIYCDDEDVNTIYEALKPYVIDHPTISVTNIYRSSLSHYLIHETQVELVGGFQVNANGSLYKTMVNELLMPYSDKVVLLDNESLVSIVPLAHELWFNYLRNRMDRVELIAHAYAEAPSMHESALLAIEASNQFTIEAKQHLHQLLGIRKAGGQ